MFHSRASFSGDSNNAVECRFILRELGSALIERYFRLTENQTTVRRNFWAALTTFITMAYIVVVNPQILSQAGMPVEGVVFATCVRPRQRRW